MRVMRFLRTLQEAGDADLLQSCTRRLFDQLFRLHTKPPDPAFLQTLASSSLITASQLEELLEKSVEPENKKRVADEAEQLVKNHGAFGLPFIIAQRTDEAVFTL